MIHAPPISTLFPYTNALPIYHPHQDGHVEEELEIARDRAAEPGPALVPRGAPHVRFLHAGAQETDRSEEHTSELQSLTNLVCRLLLEKKNHRVKDLVPLTQSI